MFSSILVSLLAGSRIIQKVINQCSQNLVESGTLGTEETGH